MARLARAEVFDPKEVAILHLRAGWSADAFYLALTRSPERITITVRFGSKIN